MAAVERKTEMVSGWYLAGEDPGWPQTADFTFCQQQQQQQQLHHQLHHLDYAPVDIIPTELQQQQHLHHQLQLFPAVQCSGFSSPASFLTPDASDSSGYLLAIVPQPGVDCDSSGSNSSSNNSNIGGHALQQSLMAPGPSASSGRRDSSGARRQPSGVAAKGPATSPHSGAAGTAAAPKVKTPGMVAKRNARERRRVEAVNSAFAKLRKYIPYEKRNKRLSKVKTLRITIDYIHLLEAVLDELNNGVDIEHSSNYQNLLQLAQRKEIAIPLLNGN